MAHQAPCKAPDPVGATNPVTYRGSVIRGSRAIVGVDGTVGSKHLGPKVGSAEGYPVPATELLIARTNAGDAAPAQTERAAYVGKPKKVGVDTGDPRCPAAYLVP